MLLKVTGKEGCQIRIRIILDKATNILGVLKNENYDDDEDTTSKIGRG